MSGPTGPVRDSSLQDRKDPGVFIRRTPQPRFGNVVDSGAQTLPNTDAVAAALVEAARDVLDPLRRRVQRRRIATCVCCARSLEATRAS